MYQRPDNQLSKEPELEQFVMGEKLVLNSLKSLVKDSDEAGGLLLKWSKNEHDDLKDICSYLSGMDTNFSQLISNMANRQTIYRQKLKEIRKLHDNVMNLSKRLDNVTSVNNVTSVEEQNLKNALGDAEREFETNKRLLLKEAMNQKYLGWAETAGKVLLIKSCK